MYLLRFRAIFTGFATTVRTVLALTARASAVLFTFTFLADVLDHYLSSVVPKSFLAWQVSGANIQPSAFAMLSILLTVSICVAIFSSLVGSNTVSGSLGLSEVEIFFLMQPDRPISISSRNTIRYLSNSLFIRVFTAGTVWLM